MADFTIVKQQQNGGRGQKFLILRRHRLWMDPNRDSSPQNLYLMILATAFRAARRVNS